MSSRMEDILQSIVDGGDISALSPPESRAELLMQAVHAKVSDETGRIDAVENRVDGLKASEVSTDDGKTAQVKLNEVDAQLADIVNGFYRSVNYANSNLCTISAQSDSGDPNNSDAIDALSSLVWSPTETAVNPWLEIINKVPLRLNRIRLALLPNTTEAKIPIVLMHEPGGSRGIDISIAEHTSLITTLLSDGWQPVFYSELIKWIYKGIYPTVASGKKPVVIHYAGSLKGVYQAYLTDLKPNGIKFNVTVGGHDAVSSLSTSDMTEMINDGLMEPHVYLSYDVDQHNPGDGYSDYNEYAYPLWDDTNGREYPDLWDTRVRGAYKITADYIRKVLGYTGDLAMEIPGSQNTNHMFEAAQFNGVRFAVNTYTSGGTGLTPGVDPFGNGNYVAVEGYGNGTHTISQIVAWLNAASNVVSSITQTVDVYVANSESPYSNTDWRTAGVFKKCATFTMNGHTIYDQIQNNGKDLEYPIYAIRIDIKSFENASVPSIGGIMLYYESNNPSDFIKAIGQNHANYIDALITVDKTIPYIKNQLITNESAVAINTDWKELGAYQCVFAKKGLLNIKASFKVTVAQDCTIRISLFKNGANFNTVGVVPLKQADANQYIPIELMWEVQAGTSDTYGIGVLLSAGTGSIVRSDIVTSIQY